MMADEKEITLPWFDASRPPLQKVLRTIEYEKPGGLLEQRIPRVIELDGGLLIFTEDAVYEETEGELT